MTLQSLPSGARVLGDGRVLGRTPLELVVPQAGLQVRLDHAGYRPQDLLLRADEPPPVVHLRAQPRRVVPELAPR